MYGLVNKALGELVIKEYGQNQWLEILKEANVEDDAFLSMESYPDQLTFTLVAAATKVLQVPSSKVLEMFGEHWITYTAQEGYGNLLDMAGNSLLDFLKNLDQLHSCVGHIMPQLKPPSFQCTDITDHSLVLHHHTIRNGLDPMIIGLIKGLGKRFNTACNVSILDAKGKEHDHSTFLISWS